VERLGDPETAKLLSGLSDGVKQSVLAYIEHNKTQLSAQFTQALDGIQRSVSEETAYQFDDALEGMGEEWTDLFGKGYGLELKDDSVEFRNRKRVYDAANSGQHRGPMAKRAVAAAKALFPDKVEKLARKSNVNKARDRGGRWINKTSQRRETPGDLSPEQRAIRAVGAKMRDLGIGVYGEDVGDDLGAFSD